jgi:glucose-6-phosphate 1-dehydrogenase
MINHGHLSIPIIGVAGRPWSIDRLRAHVHDSLEEHGGVDPTTFKKLSSMLQYVSGDYEDETTYAKLRNEVARPGE